MVECDEENRDIYIFNNMWFQPTMEEMKGDTEKGLYCPKGFCRQCDLPGEITTSCRFDIKNQCASGRDQTSFLCSKCEEGSYLAWGSTNCSKEKPNLGITVLKIVGLAVLVIVVFAFLVFQNIDIYESYLTSVIFFYQVAELFLTITQYYDAGLKFLFAICNLEGSGSGNDAFNVYFDSNFDANWQVFASFLIIITVNVIVISLIYLRKCIYGIYKKESPTANYNACVFIIFYLHGAFFQVCIRAVSLIHYKGDRLYTAPSTTITDTSDESKALFICGVISIFVASIFPFFIIFDRLDCCKWTRDGLLRHIKYLFKAPFSTSEKPKWWFGLFPIYYMLFGNLLKIGNALAMLFNLGNQIKIMILTIISVVFLIAFTLTKPYKKESGLVMSLNNFDGLILFLLCVVGVISTGKQKIPTYNVSDARLEWVVHGLLWVPIGLCLLLNGIKLLAFLVWLCYIKENKVNGIDVVTYHCSFKLGFLVCLCFIRWCLIECLCSIKSFFMVYFRCIKWFFKKCCGCFEGWFDKYCGCFEKCFEKCYWCFERCFEACHCCTTKLESDITVKFEDYLAGKYKRGHYYESFKKWMKKGT